MPRSQTGQQKSSFSVQPNTTYPRVSYTGPLMPRPTPMQSSAPSFMQTVKEGFSFGVGTSIARNLVDRLFGLNSITSSPVPTTTPTHTQNPIHVPNTTAVDSTKSIGADQLLYHNCIQDGGKHETCKDYLV